MTYQDLIEELQGYSPEELQQEVTFLFGDDLVMKSQETLSTGDSIDWITCIDDGKVVILV
jgi:hypothetical protein